MQCQPCRGQGIRLVVRQIGPGMIQQMQTTCDSCNGTGQSVSPQDRCRECKGNKTVKDKKTLEVYIKKGMGDNERIPFRGEADQAPDMEAGDVIVVLQQIPHAVFTRKGANLYIKKTITLYEALAGFTFNIKHLDGRVLEVKGKAGDVIKPGDFKAIRGEGMPLKSNPHQHGTLYVEFDVQFPEKGSLRSNDVAVLRKVLPVRAAEDAADEDAYEVRLEDVDIEAERARNKARAQQQRGAYDDEDDDDDEGGGQPQCRTQ